MVENKKVIRQNKLRSIQQFTGIFLLVILLNSISSYVFFRFDLTSEKRYSLSDASIKQIKSLEDVFYIRVYLEGNLPANYTRLRNATQDILNEFRAYSANIEYEFIDPTEGVFSEEEKFAIYQKLTKEGLQYSNIRFKEGDTYSEKIIFPGAIATYQGREVPIQLLKGRTGVPEEVLVNSSIQQLEYEFSSSLKKLKTVTKPLVAIVEDAGGLDKNELADFERALNEFYQVERINIDGKLNALQIYKAIIVAKPDSAFNEKDKFIIDQYIMKGGKALWLVENIVANMDSLQSKATSMAYPHSKNLEDIFFKYGARINTDLIMDLQALPIPIVTGYVGDKPKQEYFPWFYFPLIRPLGEHPIVKNLDAIKTQFVSSIDTVGAPYVRKTILLTSSEYTKVVMTPTRVSLNILREDPDPRQYTKKPKTIALLLEGNFDSNFKNRVPKTISENPEINFKEKSTFTKQIIISDGDIAANKYIEKTGEFYALGYDRYTNRLYANRDFLMNCMNYLSDDSGLIEARAKEFKIRLLDTQKVKEEQRKWQLINTILPIILVVIIGITQFYIRKWRFEK